VWVYVCVCVNACFCLSVCNCVACVLLCYCVVCVVMCVFMLVVVMSLLICVIKTVLRALYRIICYVPVCPSHKQSSDAFCLIICRVYTNININISYILGSVPYYAVTVNTFV
jgi:hypothetical protein